MYKREREREREESSVQSPQQFCRAAVQHFCGRGKDRKYQSTFLSFFLDYQLCSPGSSLMPLPYNGAVSQVLLIVVELPLPRLSHSLTSSLVAPRSLIATTTINYCGAILALAAAKGDHTQPGSHNFLLSPRSFACALELVSLTVSFSLSPLAFLGQCYCVNGSSFAEEKKKRRLILYF